MLAAIAIGTYFGVEAERIDAALTNYAPSNNRSQFEQTADNRLIVDAYNANPTSMAAALNNFEAINADHKMAIIGDMKELGSVSHDEHQRIVDQLSRMTLEEVWLVGSEFEHTTTPATFRKFENVAGVKEAIASEKPHDRYIQNDAYAIREVERPRCVFIDNDNPHLNGIATGLNLVRYGINAANNLYVTATDVKSEPMLSFSWTAKGKAAHHVES